MSEPQATVANGHRRSGGIRQVLLRPGPAELDPQRFRRRRRSTDILLGAGVVVFVLAIWQLASSLGWMDPRLYPGPIQVVESTIDLSNRGILWEALGITAWRAFLGYVIGAASGMIVGLAMGASRNLKAALEPFLDILYTIPKLALVPVFLTVFGFGEAPIVAMIAVSVFFFVWISALEAVMAVPQGYRDSAKVMKATRLQMFRHVLLPGALPEIAVGLRVAAGVAVLVVIGTELLIATEGLGFLINQGRSIMLLAQTYAGIVVSGVLGYLFVVIVRVLTSVAVPWAKNTSGRDHF